MIHFDCTGCVAVLERTDELEAFVDQRLPPSLLCGRRNGDLNQPLRPLVLDELNHPVHSLRRSLLRSGLVKEVAFPPRIFRHHVVETGRKLLTASRHLNRLPHAKLAVGIVAEFVDMLNPAAIAAMKSY